MIYTVHPHPHITNKLFDLLMLAFFFFSHEWLGLQVAWEQNSTWELGCGFLGYQFTLVTPGKFWSGICGPAMSLEYLPWVCSGSSISIDTFIIYGQVWCTGASLVAQVVVNPPAVWGIWVWSLGWEDPLEKRMATHSSILAWGIPWTVYRLYIRSLLFLSVWLCWVFVAARRLFIVVCGLLSSCRVPKFSSCSSRASLIAAHRLSCPTAPGILLPRLGIEPMSPALKGRS